MSSESTPRFANFKFLDLKCYASPEYLANNQKRYRRVFEASNTSYIYAELSLCNKRLELEDWDLKVIFKCYIVGADNQYLEELSSEEVVVHVSQADQIIYIHHGWGHGKAGAYWRAGTFAWVVWVDGIELAAITFGLQGEGAVTRDHNPYFDVLSLKVFEGPSDVANRLEDRVYATRFAQDTTRYIWAECIFKNLPRRHEWVCEMSFLFYTSSRELKGRNNQLAMISPHMITCDLCGGWGSPSTGTWYAGEYTLEVVFMDQLIAVLPFEIGPLSSGAVAWPRWLEGLKPKNWLFGNK